MIFVNDIFVQVITNMTSYINLSIFFHSVIYFTLINQSLPGVPMHSNQSLPHASARSGGSICSDVNHNNFHVNDTPMQHPICSSMLPRNGKYQAEPTSTSPWKIYTWKSEIQQYHTHPVVLGSDNGSQKFVNYIVTAKAVEGGHIIGHFEYQWDAIPMCCYIPGQNYSHEGTRLQPNVLIGAQGVRIQTSNQTVLWTAPRFFEGHIVFVATFWKSAKLYWPNVTSSPVTVIKRNLTKHHYNNG